MSEIKERPILFSGPMVRAILEGRKTVTRRALKNQMLAGWGIADPAHPLATITSTHPKKGKFGLLIRREIYPDSGKFEHDVIPSPYGKPGDRLWVRESTEACVSPCGSVELARYCADKAPVLLTDCADPAFDGSVDHWKYPRAVRPSIHMPRVQARILLEITDVRVERLKDISEEQAMAEGCFFTDYGRVCGHRGDGWKEVGDCRAPKQHHPQRNGWMWDKTTSHEQCLGTARWAFGNLWERVNGAESWDANPWVWVVEFKRVTP